jgi:hypothetical protein
MQRVNQRFRVPNPDFGRFLGADALEAAGGIVLGALFPVGVVMRTWVMYSTMDRSRPDCAIA